MLITYKSGSVVVDYYICEYHKKHPKEIAYAGCCCTTTYRTEGVWEANYEYNGHKHEQNKCDECDPVEFPLCNKCLGA